ncbi:discoidin domain-containing protein [Nocardia sp. NPDC051463]|uniref:discoidin domain-containing protein n=1 Tax=Nocardia sp. NPDC051463 TaxID=3154845 RepID=UPI0034506B09
MTTIPQYTATTATTGSSVSNDPPLTFDLNTAPDPVRVSPASGDAQRADFVLVGSRRSSDAIECRRITVVVPTGENSPDLTPDLTSASAAISLPDWTPTTNPAAKTITFTPTSGSAEIGRDEGVTVQLMGMRINSVVGTALLRLEVEWREAGSDDQWETGTSTFDIGKFPAGFDLVDFIAEQSVIDNGGSVEFNWEAQGVSSLRLLYDVADINVMNLTTFTVNHLARTTVFYLRATVQVGNNTVERVLSTTVTVRVPDLEVENLRVVGSLMVDWPIQITAGVVIGEDSAYPLRNVLDGNLETYYLSQSGGSAEYGGLVKIDYGTPRPIRDIHVYFGSPDGRNLPTTFNLAYSLDGEQPHFLIPATPGKPEAHWSSDEEIMMRFVQVYVHQRYGGRIAIRQFQVGRPRLHVGPAEAGFDVPVTAHRGLTEG